MKLSQLQIARKTVQLDARQSFEVRAISAVDLAMLLGRYGPMLAMAWATIAKSHKAGTPISRQFIQETLVRIIPEFPDLLAAFVAIAADEFTEEAIETVKRLPITAQAEALEGIFMLTFASEADLKKFTELLTRGAEAVAGALTGVTTTLGSGAGTGASGAT